jgi:hypothetical protein
MTLREAAGMWQKLIVVAQRFSSFRPHDAGPRCLGASHFSPPAREGFARKPTFDHQS